MMKTIALTATLLLLSPSVLPTPVLAQTKPKTKPAPQKPQPAVGIKGAGQVVGGVNRFGELFALKSGFTYQILSARYSLEPFECYSNTPPGTDEKLLILTIAIKNNRRDADNFFGEHLLKAVDASGQNYDSGYYVLRSKPTAEFGPTLKPGQGLGQGGTDPIEVVFKLPQTARVAKLILGVGREGTQEEVTRFFMADATEAEAGGKPDPKNVIAPLPDGAAKDALIPQNQSVPSWSFAFTLTGFSQAGKKGDEDAPEGKRWVYAHITVKNTMHTKQNLYEFSGGDGTREMLLRDTDGEKYPGYELLKAKRDEEANDSLEPGEERVLRVAFLVPKDATFKTALLGASRGHRYVFDASMIGK